MARVHARDSRSSATLQRRGAVFAAVALASLVPALVGTARADTVETKDPSTIACPAAPSGWAVPPASGKAVLSPMAPSVEGERYGGNAVVIICDYFATNGSGKHILASVVYALPTDINPVADFYFGCSSGGTTWTDRDRVYRVMSPDRWAIAAFTDFLGLLDDTTVPAFQNVTRQLLASTAGYAHTCDLKVQETPINSAFSYTFGSSFGNGGGTFESAGSVLKTGWVPVVSTSDATLLLTLNKRIFTLEVKHGWRFYPGRPSQQPKLSLAVRVTDSEIRSCGIGNTGTLILTQTTLQLRICNQRLSPKKASARFSYAGSN